jgi:alkylation response protein AidB-like acyl-CoA dehydrogenase
VNLDLTETQRLLRDTVRGYLEKEVSFDRIRALEREGRTDTSLWQAMAGQGWLALPFAEEHGGGGGSLVDAAVLVEELARRAAIVPVVEAIAAGRILEREGAEDLVAPLLAGEALPVPALLEAGDRFEQVAVQARDGRIRGEKAFVDHGQHATHHLVAARAGGSVGLFLVDARGPEVSCQPLRSIGRTPLAAVRYQDAPGRQVAGEEGLRDLIRTGRALAAVQCVGSMQTALDMTVRYASIREQFGRPIGAFQAVRHHCANMAMRVASARLLAYQALAALDGGTASDEEIALAKASASRAAPEVTMLAHQIFGGNGVIEENDLYFFTLRGKERSLAWGSVEECLEIVAATVHEPRDWI